MMPMEHKLTRQELYDKVWATPMSRLASEFGISDVGLAKACKRHDIPRPPVGYWAKKEYGKPVRKPPLPKRVNDPLEVVCLVGTSGLEDRLAGHPEVARRIVEERDATNEIIVANTVETFHPLVERTVRSLRGRKPDEDGLVSPRAKHALQVNVGPESVDRAVRILDALVRALEERSLEIAFIQPEDVNHHSYPVVRVEGEEIGFSLFEKLDKKPKEYSSAELKRRERSSWRRDRVEYEYWPSGKLCLAITRDVNLGCRSSWSDGKRQRIETCLNRFVAGLYEVAHLIRQRRQEHEERKRHWAEDERRRKESEQRQREEIKRIQQLDHELVRFKKAEMIRRYSSSLSASMTPDGCELLPWSKVGRHIEWMLHYADQVDPTKPEAGEPIEVDHGVSGSFGFYQPPRARPSWLD